MAVWLREKTTSILDESERYKPCGEKTCLICDFILLRPLQRKPATKILKFVVVPLHVIPKNFLIYWNVKFVVKFPTLGKRKPNFVIGLITIKVNTERLEKVIGKFLRNFFTLTIASMATATFKIGILHTQLKEKETFCEHKKAFKNLFCSFIFPSLHGDFNLWAFSLSFGFDKNSTEKSTEKNSV